MTAQSPQDGSGGAEVGSAVHGEGSEAPAGAEGVTEADRERAGMVAEQSAYRGQAVLRKNIAAALAEERAKARAPFLALAERMGAEGDPAIRYYANRIAEMVENAP